MGKIIKIFFSIALLLWVSGFAIFLVSAKNLKNKDDYIEYSIVLTGGRNRVQEGISLIDSNSTDFLFISGVNNEVDKKSVLSADFGNHKNDVELGYEATSTKENVEESSKWIKDNYISEVRIITSDYHLFRSKLEFEHYLPNIEKEFHSVSSINDEFLSSASNWKLLAGEFNKLVYVFIMQGVL